MRLLMLPRYDSLGASSRLRLLQYVPALRSAGFEVDIAPLLDDAYVTGLYAGRVSPWRVLRAYFRRIRVLFAAGRYDVVWLEKELFPWWPAWLERLLPTGRTAVVVDYDDAVFHRYDRHPSRAVRWLLGRKIDKVMRGATAVVVGNEYLAMRARAAGARRVEWVPTVVDLARYIPPAGSPRAETFTIGWIGSPATAHYLAPLASAAREIAAQRPVRCLAVGARPDQVLGTPFEACKWTENTEVAQIHAFDVGIMPLPDESWERGKCGYKLIQYMACGVPVIASPVGANVDIVKPGENGLLARTPDEWRGALERLAADPGLRRRMGEVGRLDVEQTYSLQAQAARLVDILRDASKMAVH